MSFQEEPFENIENEDIHRFKEAKSNLKSSEDCMLNLCQII